MLSSYIKAEGKLKTKQKKNIKNSWELESHKIKNVFILLPQSGTEKITPRTYNIIKTPQCIPSLLPPLTFYEVRINKDLTESKMSILSPVALTVRDSDNSPGLIPIVMLTWS